MPENPEDKVLDVIDQLVEQSLRKPQDDYNAAFSETCEHCGFEWHGAPSALGCPGAFGTDDQLAAWRENGPGTQHLVGDDGDVVLHGVVLIGSIVDAVMGLATLTMFPEQQALIVMPPSMAGEPPGEPPAEEFVDLGYVEMDDARELLGRMTMPFHDQRQITFGFNLENDSCQALWQQNEDEDTPES